MLANTIKFFQEWWLPAAQVAVWIIALWVANINLKKEFRKHGIEIKKESQRILGWSVVSTVISIIIVIALQLSGNSQKIHLYGKIDSLKSQNDSLHKQSSGELITQARNIIESNTKSADRLEKASKSIVSLINGTDVIPTFHLVIANDSTQECTLANTSLQPAYNISVTLINYTNILNCKSIILFNKLVFDTNCLDINTQFYQIPVLVYGRPQNLYLPSYNRHALSGKYLISFIYRTRFFEQQIMYSVKNRGSYKSMRLIEYKKDKPILVKILSNELRIHDWKKEFPKSNFFNAGKYNLDKHIPSGRKKFKTQ